MGYINSETCRLGAAYFARLKKEREQNTVRIPSRLLYAVHGDLVSQKATKRK